MATYFQGNDLFNFCYSAYQLGINPMPLLRKKFPSFVWEYSVDGMVKNTGAITVSGIFGGWQIHYPTTNPGNFIINPIQGDAIPAGSVVIQTVYRSEEIFSVDIYAEEIIWAD